MLKCRILAGLFLIGTLLNSGCIFYPHQKAMSPEIYGKVIDHDTLKPLDEVVVEVFFPKDYYQNDLQDGIQLMGKALSDSNGDFKVNSRMNKLYFYPLLGMVVYHGKVIVSKVGYVSKTIYDGVQVSSRETEAPKLDLKTIKLKKIN